MRIVRDTCIYNSLYKFEADFIVYGQDIDNIQKSTLIFFENYIPKKLVLLNKTQYVVFILRVSGIPPVEIIHISLDNNLMVPVDFFPKYIRPFIESS